MKEIIKNLIRLTGFDIYNTRKSYLPNDDAYLIKKALLSSIQQPVIFDVGAYYGDVSLKYLSMIENCRIFAFEPSKKSYETILEKIKNKKNIKAFNCALGNKNGTATLNLNKFDATNSLLPSIKDISSKSVESVYDTLETTEVEVVTLDSFCTQHNIEKIDLLKMDTQGTEYRVIEGAKEMIANRKISMIYTEIIIQPTYVGQIEMYEFMKLIHDSGFRLFNFYNYEFIEGRLCQLDAIYQII